MHVAKVSACPCCFELYGCYSMQGFIFVCVSIACISGGGGGGGGGDIDIVIR